MAVELTGYSRQIDPDTRIKRGFEEIKTEAGKDRALGHLIDLRRDLQAKSGVVRLLHTTSTDKDMKFKNAGAFKQLFLSGEKLARSGEVITSLLEQAGLPTEKVKAFKVYADGRGNKGVQAQKVLQYIDALQADRGRSPQEALRNFGVDLGSKGRLLGSGGYGEAHVVEYRGEEFVYKQPGSAHANIGTLTLVDGSGNEFKPAAVIKPEEMERSFVSASAGNSAARQKGPPKDEHSLSSNSSHNNQVLGSFLGELMFDGGKRPVDGGESSHSSISAESQRNSVQEPVAGPQLSGPPLIIEEESVAEPQAEALPVFAEGQKLSHTGMANAARIKDLPQVITPTVYVIRERRSDATEVYHAVGGGKTLKDWATVQDRGSTYEVVGLLMPKAKGKSPIVYPEKKSTGASGSQQVKVNVAPADLKPMAVSAMELLRGLAKGGFIHGDFKPENLSWDGTSKVLEVFDNDDLTKVSKHGGSTVPELGTHTLMYLNPVGLREASINNETVKARMGVGQDLFAMGLVLLETSMMAKANTPAERDAASQFIDDVTMGNLPKDKMTLLKGSPSRDKTLTVLRSRDFPADTVEAFAKKCIEKAVAFEQGRLDRGDQTFDRDRNSDQIRLLDEITAELDQVVQ